MGQPQSRPPPPPPGIELRCIVVNDGAKINVTIDQSSKGQELKFALKEQASLACAAINLELFIAKRIDGSRVGVTEEHRRQMKAGYVPYEIFKTMTEDNMVNPWSRLSDFTLPSADQLQNNEYQVLVQMSGRLGVEPTWRDEDTQERSLDSGFMHFVKRVEAMTELQSIHDSLYYSHKGAGRQQLEIPYADNMSGLGKSVFGINYIRWCREMWPEESTRNDFQRELCSCHTVRLSPPSPEVLGDEVRVDLVITSLVEAINGNLEPDTELDITPDSSLNLSVLTRKLVEKLGPLFIVVDDVADWFTNTSTPLELFYTFCKEVLRLWLQIPRVYFVVLGSTEGLWYLNDVALLESNTPPPCAFKRLGLYLLRPREIEEILCNTRAFAQSHKMISQVWGLETEAAVKKAAQALFQRSGGDPRALFALLRQHRSCESLEEASFSGADSRRLELLRRELKTHRKRLNTLLRMDEPVNLRQMVEVGETTGGGYVVLANLLTQCYIAWEGDVKHAKIYALADVKHEITNILYPLREYVHQIASSIDHVSPNHSNVWEWMCIKRFCELFSESCKPKEKLPAFFKENTIFGDYEAVRFSPDVLRLPQIRPRTNLSSEGSVLMSAKSVNPGDWPKLLREIGDMLCSRDASLTFKFAGESNSADALLMARDSIQNKFASSHENNKRRKLMEKTRTLTVGLAAKNYYGSQLTVPGLQAECKKFNATFEGTLQNERSGTAAVGETEVTPLRELVNILIVCGTNYIDELRLISIGTGVIQMEESAHVHQVLVLPLTTPQKRAEFFGFDKKTPEGLLLSNTVEKIVEKYEPERQH